MSVITEFIKATGNCRIKKSLIKELIKKQASCKPYCTWIIDNLRKLKIDDSEDDYVSLEQIGEVYDNSFLSGHIDSYTVWDLHLLYQIMSLNGMECFKSVTSPPDPSKGRSADDYESLDEIVVEGILQSEIEFKSFDELYRYFDMLNKPIMNISISKTERFCDLNIVTESDELIKQHNNKKKCKYNTEPCRLYFCDDDDHYFYFEFLSYGKGIKMGTCLYYPYVNGDDTIAEYYDTMNKFLKNVRNEYFTWSVEDLY